MRASDLRHTIKFARRGRICLIPALVLKSVVHRTFYAETLLSFIIT